MSPFKRVSELFRNRAGKAPARRARSRRNEAFRAGFDRLEQRAVLSAAPVIGPWGWAASFGDEANRSRVTGVAEDGLGNAYAVGWYEGTVNFDPSKVAPAVSSAGNRDIFVAKYSPSGNLDWVRSFGGGDVDEGMAITVNADGRIIVTGAFSQTVDFDPGPGVASLQSAGVTDAFVLAMNSAGEHIWSGRYGGPEPNGLYGGVGAGDFARSVSTDAAGNIFICGIIHGQIDVAFGGSKTTIDAGGNYFDTIIVSLTANGTLRFAKFFDGNFLNDGAAVVDRQGNIVITGALHSTQVDFDPGPGQQLRGFVGLHDVYVAKLDNNGNFMWAFSFGSPGEDGVDAHATVDAEGNIFYAGHFSGTIDADPGPKEALLVSAGGTDAFVISLDPSGKYRWAKRFGGTASGVDVGEGVKSIALNKAGGLEITTEIDRAFTIDLTSGPTAITVNGTQDTLRCTLDATDGRIISATSFGGPDAGRRGSSDAGYVTSVASGSTYYFGGTSGTFDVDPSEAGVAMLAAGDATTGFIWKLGPTEVPAETEIVAANPGDASVSLAWRPPAATDKPVRDYSIEYSSDDGATWKTFARPASTDVAAVVTGLTNGTAYRFRVAAVNATGVGAYSKPSDKVTPAVKPGVPGNVAGTSADRQVPLTWTAPEAVTGVTITDYVIQYSSDNGAVWRNVVDQTSAATSATVDGLVNGTNYVFRVAAVNAGVVGDFSPASAAVIPAADAGAPSSVVAITGNGKVSLYWDAPSSENNADVTDYVVQYSSDGGTTWTPFEHEASPETWITVTGLTNGTAYRFRVAAVNAAGPGTFSTTIALATPQASVPDAPIRVTAIPGDREAKVSWSAPESDGGGPIRDYVVQYSSNGGTSWTTFADAISLQLNSTVTGLTNGIAYLFRVAAVNATGAGRVSLNSAAVTPRPLPGLPTALRAVAGNALVNLTWTAPAVTGGSPITDYLVQSSSDGGGSWRTLSDGLSATAGSTVAGLINGVAYVFRVAAVSAAGTGSWTAASTAVTPRGPATAPQNLVAIPGDGRVVLEWDRPASFGGASFRQYLIEQSTDGGRNWSPASSGTSRTTTATVSGLANGTTYVFRVAAETTLTKGVFCPATAAILPLGAPAPVSQLVVQPSGSQFVLTWNAPASNGGRAITDYLVEYRSGSLPWTPWTHTASAARTATIPGLPRGDGYRFRVRAVTSFATGSAVETAEASVMVAGPAQLTGKVNRDGVALKWSAPATPRGVQIVDYRVQFSEDGSRWTTFTRGRSAANGATIRGLTPNRSYLFRVAAVTSRGIGGYSANSSRLTPLVS